MQNINGSSKERELNVCPEWTIPFQTVDILPMRYYWPQWRFFVVFGAERRGLPIFANEDEDARVKIQIINKEPIVFSFEERCDICRAFREQQLAIDKEVIALSNDKVLGPAESSLCYNAELLFDSETFFVITDNKPNHDHAFVGIAKRGEKGNIELWPDHLQYTKAQQIEICRVVREIQLAQDIKYLNEEYKETSEPQ